MPKARTLMFEDIDFHKPIAKLDVEKWTVSNYPSKQYKFSVIKEAREKGFIPGARVIRTHHVQYGEHLKPEHIGTIVKYLLNIQPQELMWYPILVRFIEHNQQVTHFGYNIKDIVLYDSIKNLEDIGDNGYPFN